MELAAEDRLRCPHRRVLALGVACEHPLGNASRSSSASPGGALKPGKPGEERPKRTIKHDLPEFPGDMNVP